jgi:hypothetical protein
MQIIRCLLPIRHFHIKANYFLLITVVLFAFNTCGAQTIETLTATQLIWNLVYMNRLTGVGYKRIGD